MLKRGARNRVKNVLYAGELCAQAIAIGIPSCKSTIDHELDLSLQVSITGPRKVNATRRAYTHATFSPHFIVSCALVVLIAVDSVHSSLVAFVVTTFFATAVHLSDSRVTELGHDHTCLV